MARGVSRKIQLKVLTGDVLSFGMFSRVLSALFVSGYGILLSGCGDIFSTPKAERTTYFHPVRQVAPEPVYNRITMVRPPDTLPFMPIGVRQPYANRDVKSVSIYAKDVTLDEASKIVADAIGYKSYCSSLIGKKRVTIKQNGTIEQLATDLSNREKIEVIIDHDSKEIRFLQQRSDDNSNSQLR